MNGQPTSSSPSRPSTSSAPSLPHSLVRRFLVAGNVTPNVLCSGRRTTPHPRRNPHPLLVSLRPLPSLDCSLFPYRHSRLPPNVHPRLSPQLPHRQEAVRHRRHRDHGGVDHSSHCARAVAGGLRRRGAGGFRGCVCACCDPSSYSYRGTRDGEGGAPGPPARQPYLRPPTVRLAIPSPLYVLADLPLFSADPLASPSWSLLTPNPASSFSASCLPKPVPVSAQALLLLSLSDSSNLALLLPPRCRGRRTEGLRRRRTMDRGRGREERRQLGRRCLPTGTGTWWSEGRRRKRHWPSRSPVRLLSLAASNDLLNACFAANYPARELYEATWRTLDNALSVSTTAALDALPDPSPQPPRVFITSWVDYTHKYGTAYSLTDGSSGLYYNDSTTMVLSPDKVYVRSSDDFREQLTDLLDLSQASRLYLQLEGQHLLATASRRRGSPEGRRAQGLPPQVL